MKCWYQYRFPAHMVPVHRTLPKRVGHKGARKSCALATTPGYSQRGWKRRTPLGSCQRLSCHFIADARLQGSQLRATL
jgi:hypothetical protein